MDAGLGSANRAITGRLSLALVNAKQPNPGHRYIAGATAHDPFEGGAEGTLGFVAEGLRDDGDGIAGVLQTIPCQ